MGIVNQEEIRGYQLEKGAIICTECIEVEEAGGVDEDEILTEVDVDKDEKIYFCDRCKKRL
jgi:hypothetical protein